MPEKQNANRKDEYKERESAPIQKIFREEEEEEQQQIPVFLNLR